MSKRAKTHPDPWSLYQPSPWLRHRDDCDCLRCLHEMSREELDKRVYKGKGQSDGQR